MLYLIILNSEKSNIMNKKILIALLLCIGLSFNTNAFWGNGFGNNWGNGFGNNWGNGFGNGFGNNRGNGFGNGFGNNWGNGFGNWNPYYVLDPRYWIEEMENMFDNDWDNWRRYDYSGYGGYPSYGNYDFPVNIIDSEFSPSYNPYYPKYRY